MIVLGSDDGAGAAGLTIFRDRLRERGYEPELAVSGSAASGTGTASAGPGGHRTCAAAVADSVRRSEPTLVLLGVNHGPNIWPLAVHSGTMGGLLAAMSLGVSAIAVSADDEYCVTGEAMTPGPVPPVLDFAAASLVCQTIAGLVPGLGGRLFGVSINVPGIEPRQIAGAEIATAPVRRGTAQRSSGAVEACLLAAGRISLLPLSSPYTGVSSASHRVARLLLAALERDGFGHSHCGLAEAT